MNRPSGRIQHPIIADDRSTPGLRRLDATLTNSALERLEGGQTRQRTAGIGFALDEMHKGIVVEPQRKIAKAFRLCGLQFRKHPGNQLRVLVGQFRLCLIPDQGPFHHSLHGLRDEIAASHPPWTFGACKKIRSPKNNFRPNPPPLPMRPVHEPPHEAAETKRRDAMQEANARGEKNWVLGVTALASFMMALDAQVITTAFATIRSDFGASVETLQWTVNAYNLTFAVLLLTGAALGDRFGRRLMFAAGILLFAMGSARCALSGSAAALIAARSVQDAGAALVMPLAMAILSSPFPREERARSLGIFSGVTGFALIIGPAIGGLITESLGWRWIFWINLPIGLIAIALVRARLGESFGPRATLDLPGLIIVAAAALALVWGLLRGNLAGWSSAEVVGTLVLGVLFALGFVALELRAPAPMVPMRLFQSRGFSAGIAASLLFRS